MTITLEDLIKAGKSEVRYNSNLLTAYKKLFAEKFGREPDCAGCTFDSDWNRLITNQNFSNREIMSENTFKLRDNSIIYTYQRENPETKTSRPIRTFGNKMTEEFAEAYLTEGTSEQIAQRKKQFKILPKKFQPTESAPADTNKYPEKLVDMKAYAAFKEYPEEEYSSITRKADMIAYLNGKAVEIPEEEIEEDDVDQELDDETDEDIQEEEEEEENEEDQPTESAPAE